MDVTVGHWPPPRATVVLGVHGAHTELTPDEARSLARLLTERALGAEGDEDWWTFDRRAHPFEPGDVVVVDDVPGVPASLAMVHCVVCGNREAHPDHRAAAARTEGAPS